MSFFLCGEVWLDVVFLPNKNDLWTLCVCFGCVSSPLDLFVWVELTGVGTNGTTVLQTMFVLLFCISVCTLKPLLVNWITCISLLANQQYCCVNLLIPLYSLSLSLNLSPAFSHSLILSFSLTLSLVCLILTVSLLFVSFSLSLFISLLLCHLLNLVKFDNLSTHRLRTRIKVTVTSLRLL